jgi:integrase
MAEGIEVRHGKDCRSRQGLRCNCKPSYRASVWSQRDGKKIKKTFPTEAAAKAWRIDVKQGLAKGTMRAPTPITVAQAAEAFMAAARAGTILSDHHEPYRAATIRAFDQVLRFHVLPRFGAFRLADLRHTDVQEYADKLTAVGMSRSTVDAALLPLGAIYRRAVKRGEVGINPVLGVSGGRRKTSESRFATPAEAAALIAVLRRPIEKAAWATMFYGGLRMGEMLALRWQDIDFANGRLRVERSWDGRAKVFNEPKTKAGKRTVPLLAQLRPILLDHRMNEAQAGRGEGEQLVFSRLAWAGSAQAYAEQRGHKVEDPAATPTTTTTLATSAYQAWNDAGLERMNPHGCRHTFASVAIAAMNEAGKANAKIIQEAMGHANLAMTFDTYGHLFPGTHEELGGMMDAYLEAQAAEALRIQQLEFGPDDR